jgi:DNA (cytosine-5)-methyltransferase 1
LALFFRGLQPPGKTVRRRIKERGTIVDLFSGCGGFSLGAELVGFRSLAAIDIDPILQSAYRKNFPRSRVIQANVGDIEASDWKHLIGKVRPDGVIGGPPCQGFSWIGKRRKNDPRNFMIGQFYKHVRILRPKFFIMENVLGLLDGGNLKILADGLEQVPSRYKILKPIVVSASQFGAATSRRRVVVVGYDPDEVDSISPELINPRGPRELVTVRDAISDLPAPISEAKAKGDFGWTKYPLRSALTDYAESLRKLPPIGLGWTEAIEHHANGFVSGLIETHHTKKVARRYGVIEGGKSDPITKAYRLEWNGQCPTIRAGTGADKGAFQAVRPLHPGKGRVITIREGARLQGFPDWFVFHPTKWHSFRMIGNSVSPFVSKGIFKSIASKIA